MLVPAKTPAEIKNGPLARQFKNTNKAISMLDDSIEKAIQVLINGLDDKDKYYRFNCACTLIKKVIPDKKIKEISGLDGKSINIDVVDKRQAVVTILNILDEVDMNDLEGKITNGSFRLLEPDGRAETEATFEVEGETSSDSGGRRSRRNKIKK